MIWVASSLVVVVAVFSVFVLGLLRSFADIVRRLAQVERALRASQDGETSSTMPDGVLPLATSVSSAVLSDIRGYTTTLEPITIELAEVSTSYLLLAFLSTSCFSCLDIWRDVIAEGEGAAVVTASPGQAATLVILLKDRETENLGKAHALAKDTKVPVLFAGELWDALDVAGSPYFALVDMSTRRLAGAGSARSWGQLKSLATDAMLEISLLAERPPPSSSRGYRSIIEREDEELMRAGIHPGHPSLTAPISGAEPPPTRSNGGST